MPAHDAAGGVLPLRDEDCVDDVLEGYCSGIGTFFPLQRCDEIECGGGCCQTDGSCTDDARDQCDGRFLGAGASCEPNPCYGACCDADGACAARTEGDCSLRHGEFLGYAQACVPDLCVGACCNLITGECRQVVEDLCASDGDVWHGAGTSCDDVVCGASDGGCCLSTGACEAATAAECVSADGTWLGLDSVCDDSSCDGACCNLVTGACTDVVGPECSGEALAWSGLGSTCSEVEPCATPLAACCGTDGAGDLATPAECATADDVSRAGQLCESGTCVGACCNRAIGECTEGVAADDCVGTGLTWGGYGSTCADLDCQPDQDLDGIIDDDDNCVAIPNHGQSSIDGDALGDVCDPTPFPCIVASGGSAVTGLSSLVTVNTCQDELQALLDEVEKTCFTTCVWGVASTTQFLDDTGTLQNTWVCCSSAWAGFACTDCPGAEPMCPDPDVICPANNPF